MRAMRSDGEAASLLDWETSWLEGAHELQADVGTAVECGGHRRSIQ